MADQLWGCHAEQVDLDAIPVERVNSLEKDFEIVPVIILALTNGNEWVFSSALKNSVF